MKVWTSISILIVSIALMVACRAAEPIATPTPAPTPVPTREAVATPIPSATLTPSATPIPRPTPTPTFSPTPTPVATQGLPSARSLALSTGSTAPDFQLTLFDGKTLRLSNLKGQVVVLNFWASWCPPCRWEMPAFERIWQEYQDQGVVFLGVAVSDFEEDARTFAEGVGVTYHLGMDTTGEIATTYRILGMPTTYFIDRQGNVAKTLINAANEGVLRVFLAGQLSKN